MNKPNEYHCFPMRVTEFYPDEQLVDCIISADLVHSTSEEKYVSSERREIRGVPLHVISGGYDKETGDGGFAITIPIVKGDTGSIFFSQIGYDHWLYEDKDKAESKLAGMPLPHLLRSFSINDGFAMVGFNTIPRAIQDYEPDAIQIRNRDKTSVVAINADGSVAIWTESEVVVDCNTMKVTGNLEVDGEITAKAGTPASVGLSTHNHSNTGAPVAGT